MPVLVVPVGVDDGNFASDGGIRPGVAHEKEGDGLIFLASLVAGCAAGAGVIAGNFPVFVLKIAAVVIESGGGKRQGSEEEEEGFAGHGGLQLCYEKRRGGASLSGAVGIGQVAFTAPGCGRFSGCACLA